MDPKLSHLPGDNARDRRILPAGNCLAAVLSLAHTPLAFRLKGSVAVSDDLEQKRRARVEVWRVVITGLALLGLVLLFAAMVTRHH